MIARPLWSAILASIAGAGVTLSLQPFHLWPLAIASAGILYWLLIAKPLKQSYLIALAFNAGLFLSGASWVYVSIHEFGYASPLLASLLTILFCGGIAAINAASLCCFALIPANRQKQLIGIMCFASIATASESIRAWVLTGFPWLNIGYSQTDAPLSGYAPIFGVYGISFLIYLLGALCVDICGNRQASLYRIGKTQGRGIALVTTIVLGGLALQQVSWTTISDRPQRVAMIQANISQHQKWQPSQLQPTLALYQKMSEDYWQTNDLIIWPEAAIPAFYQQVSPYFQQLNLLAVQQGSALLSGIPTIGNEQYQRRPPRNSVIAVGNASGVYHKEHLVPFGEYVPLENIFGKLMAFFELPMSGMQAGEADQEPLFIHDWRSRPLICYEIVYPTLTAKAAAVSDVLITVSNDSWFGKSLGPIQHLQMAQMRALENGKYLLRSTGNGISAIINQQGKIVSRSEQFSREVITGEFFLSSGSTPWTQFGYWLIHGLYLSPIIACAMFSLRKGS